MTQDIPQLIFLLEEEYYGDPGPPSYNVVGAFRSIESAREEVGRLKEFPMNKMCSYTIHSLELVD